MTTRRNHLARAALAVLPAAFVLLGLSASAIPAVAQPAAGAFPNRTITIVVPFTAGGTTDFISRMVGQGLAAELGQPVIIDNRPGAGGNIGGQFVAKSAPDGYTLLVGTTGSQTINRFLFKKLPYDSLTAFVPITRIANVANVLVTNPARPFKTVPDLIAYAKANPGAVTYGSSGIGTVVHLSGEMFAFQAGVKMTHVPYKGSAPAVNDLLGNQLTVMFDNLPSSIEHIRAGKLRAIAVTSAKRLADLPNVPTIAESGLPGYETIAWFGLFAPAGTPPAIVDRIHAAVVKVLASDAVKRKFAEQGAEAYGEPQAAFAKYINEEAAKWSEVVRRSGTTLE